MSTAHDSLENPVQAERRTVPVLRHEQDPAGVQSFDTAPQKRFEIPAQRPESMTGRGGSRRIQHDPGITLIRAKYFEKAPAIDAHGFVSCRIDATISIGSQVHFESFQIGPGEVDRRDMLRTGREQRCAEGPRMRKQIQPVSAAGCMGIESRSVSVSVNPS